MKKLILLLLIALSFSCSNTSDGVQDIINLKVNGCFDPLERNAKICLDSIFDDSRCPKGLVCVWGGDVVAAFTLTKNNIVWSFNLHTNEGFQNDTIIAGIGIKLQHITPYPIGDQTIDPNDYRAEIIINEN